MKKLFFTAIAIVAFNSLSFAISKEVKIKEINAVRLGCADAAMLQTNSYEENSGGCLTTSQWNYAYNVFYNNCIKNCN